MWASSKQQRQLNHRFQVRYGASKGGLRYEPTPFGLARQPAVDASSVRAPVSAFGTNTAGQSTAASSTGTAAAGQRVVAQALTMPPFAVRMLNHMTYGATQASIAAFNALGSTDAARLTAYVNQQLNWQSIDDSAMQAMLNGAGYSTLAKPLSQLWAEHVRPDPAYETRMRPAWEVQRAALARAAYSKRQLLERMVDFWHNHFNVTVTDYVAGPVYPHLDGLMRQHAFGNFKTLLTEVTKSTAMMYYLDNRSNTRSGPNENFARELLELHTLGAENYLGFVDPFQVPKAPEDANFPIGYTDIDVYEVASAFTGWSVKDGHWQFPNDNDGTFVYRQQWHDAGPKFILGKFFYPEQPAMKDGLDVIDRLARHPKTAKYICMKLIRSFLTDNPPQALIDSAAAVFRQNVDSAEQMKLVMRHILTSSVAQTVWGEKRRRPFEAIASGLRMLQSQWVPRVGEARSNDLFWFMGFTGHMPYDWPAPNGYPDVAGPWRGTNAFVATWKVLGWLTEANNSGAYLCPILQKAREGIPASQWTANRLVTEACTMLFGYQPDAARKQAAIAFLAQNGDPDSYVITDTNTWAGSDMKRHYNQERIRSTVALLLMSPDFLNR